MTAATTTAPVPGKSDARIGLRANLRHIGALVRRYFMQIRYEPFSMFDALATPIVFSLLFTYVFGGAMTGGNRSEYVNYFIPGLMAMGGLNIAMSIGTGVSDDFNKGVMDRFHTLPIARSSVLIAKLVVESGRMLVSTVILLIMGFIMGFELETGPLELLAAVLLALVFGSSLTWIFMLLGMSLPTPQAVSGMGFIVIMPLQFGSSIFAPTATMPDWLQSFTEYNPLSRLADAARALTSGRGAVAEPVTVTLIWALAITVIVAPLAVRKFRDKTT